ncbi:MAG: phasin family protein [Pacificimonas sp.]
MTKTNNPTETMKAQAETAMNQGKAAMADVTAKSREAMERGVKTVEEMNDFARGNVEAVVEASKVYADGTQEMMREQVSFVKSATDELAANMKAMPTVKNPNEIMQMHGDFVRNQFDAMVEQNSKMTERMFKLAGDVMAPLQNRMAVANEKFTKVAA